LRIREAAARHPDRGAALDAGDAMGVLRPSQATGRPGGRCSAASERRRVRRRAGNRRL